MLITFLFRFMGEESRKEYPTGKSYIHKTASSSCSCQILPDALSYVKTLKIGSCSSRSSLVPSAGLKDNCWQWGILFTGCGEEVFYTDDNAVLTNLFCYIFFFSLHTYPKSTKQAHCNRHFLISMQYACACIHIDLRAFVKVSMGCKTCNQLRHSEARALLVPCRTDLSTDSQSDDLPLFESYVGLLLACV